jgi:hypothetical protein
MNRLMISVPILLLGVCSLSEPIYAETGAAEGIFKQTCTRCHSLKRINSKRKTKTGWGKTVNRMLEKLASRGNDLTGKGPDIKISPEEANQITAYLYAERGYTNPDTGVKKEEERKRKFREQYPASKARTVSPSAKTVK